MRTFRFGDGAEELSVIGHGTFSAGGGHHWGRSSEGDRQLRARSVASIRAALDAGVNWIDTAEIYGSGKSEEMVAEAIGRRRDVFVATKVAPAPEGSGLLPHQIRSACIGSLRRLRVDHIDLYQVHWPDANIPIADTWAGMTQLAQEGLVRYLGVSHFTRGNIQECLNEGDLHAVQVELSPLETKDMDLAEWCAGRGMTVITFGPLAYGLLTEVIQPGMGLSAANLEGTETSGWLGEMFQAKNFRRVATINRKMRAIAYSLGITLPQLCVAWNLHQVGVAATLIGSRNVQHVLQNVRGSDVSLSPEVLQEVQAVIERTERD